MRELNDSFAKLIGRQPSDVEIQTLYRVRDALDLRSNDALWLVIMALQHYQWQYEEMPKAIAGAAKDALKCFNIAANISAKASIESAKADLAKAVAESATQVARDVAGTQKIQWLAGCAFTVAVTFGTVFWYVHQQAFNAGFNNGLGIGYSHAKDEKAAAAWANTPEGKRAYELALVGSIGRLVSCDQPGWHIENGVCYVKPAPGDNIYGWRVP